MAAAVVGIVLGNAGTLWVVSSWRSDSERSTALLLSRMTELEGLTATLVSSCSAAGPRKLGDFPPWRGSRPALEKDIAQPAPLPGDGK
jgi:hypothetical protein